MIRLQRAGRAEEEWGWTTGPSAFFDSGLGGLTVVRQLLSTLPGGGHRVFWGYRPGPLRYPQPRDDRKIYPAGLPFPAVEGRQADHRRVRHGQLGRVPYPPGIARPAMGVVEPTADAAVSASKTGRIGDSGDGGDHPVRLFRETDFGNPARCGGDTRRLPPCLSPLWKTDGSSRTMRLRSRPPGGIWPRWPINAWIH